mmetsp:Transcript_21626/g.50531  ORF Transcript_21626/g.50531 Transcript_21626/m.50531 type:complete len:506 (+) Transcript_21626:114-1631(+)
MVGDRVCNKGGCRLCSRWLSNLWTDPTFARAFLISVPPAIFAAALEAFENYRDDSGSAVDLGVYVDGQVYSVITTLLGFLIVFRNSQAYGRFWEACSNVYQMQAQLYDAASSLVSFCSVADSRSKEVGEFRNTLIRLLSLTNSLMMASLHSAAHGETTEISLPVLDPSGLNSYHMHFLEKHGCKVEIVAQWIQQLTVTQLRTGVIDVPAPIATRAFQEIGSGVLQFHEAMKIAEVGFPTTYVTTMMVLLWVHMVLTPICMTAWVGASGWAFILTFIATFTLWALALLGLELDNPFKHRKNRNIDFRGLHMEYNERLVSLVAAAQLPQDYGVKGSAAIEVFFQDLDNGDGKDRHMSQWESVKIKGEREPPGKKSSKVSLGSQFLNGSRQGSSDGNSDAPSPKPQSDSRGGQSEAAQPLSEHFKDDPRDSTFSGGDLRQQPASASAPDPVGGASSRASGDREMMMEFDTDAPGVQNVVPAQQPLSAGASLSKTRRSPSTGGKDTTSV